MSAKIKAEPINGIDVEALHGFVGTVTTDPAAGMVSFGVLTTWQGGTRTRATILPIQLGDSCLVRDFAIEADEPVELLGTNKAPNPQELLLAALNACLTATYAAHAAAMGIELIPLTICTKGTLDLRGFLGIEPAINPGYDSVEYEVKIESSAEKAALERLHVRAQATSPNFHNFARAIELNTRLSVRD